MRQTLLFSIATLAIALPASAQPKIGSIVNAASFAQNSTGDSVIAQGSIFTIFGTGLGPAAGVQPPSLPLAPTLGGTSVNFSSGGQTIAAFPVFVSATQVNAIVPSNTPIGEASVTVTSNGEDSPPAKVYVAKASLGIFNANGPGIAQIARSATDVTLDQLTNPAHGGDTLILYGTGLGPISGPDNAAPGSVQPAGTVTLTIGGKTVMPLYAGRSPNFPGLDQINVQLPADVPADCYTPAEVTAGGEPSNGFVLSTAASGASFCVHPLGLGQAALARLDAGNTVNIGVFQLLRAVLFGLQAEGAGGIFVKANAAQVYQTYLHVPMAFGTFSYPAPLNSCVVYDDLVPSGFSIPNFKQDIGGTELNAGAALQVSGPGPNGSQGVLGVDSGGYLATFLVPGGVYSAGAWAVSGTGGPDVGAFSAKITLPDNFIWTNAGNFSGATSVPNSDLTVTWTGGTSSANPVVYIFGNSSVINANDSSKNRGKTFTCAAPASAVKFAVPMNIRSQLPSSTTAASETSSGTLGLTTGGSTSFSAPLTSGNLDIGFIGYGEAQAVSVKYQ